MNKRLNLILIIGGVIVIAAIILTSGIFIARAMAGTGGTAGSGGSGNSGNYGYGMMGGYNGGGMMSGYNGGGMMGNYGPSGSTSTNPLTVDQAKGAVEAYLKGLNNPDLVLKEIMVFQNNAYARIIEKSTGVGAMELLVNPTSLSVFPEYGPNMMWNLKYSPMYNSTNTSGMMGGRNGMMGGRNGMMGGLAQNTQGNPPSVSATMPVTPEQAVQTAQKFIDQKFPGSQADPEPDAFYGYYTIDILKDGNPIGMLSVNGFNQQVFYHTWHGNFIEATEY